MTPKKRVRRRAPKTYFSGETAAFEHLLRKTRGNRIYVLKLYVTGTSPRSRAAIGNIRALCEDYLSGRYQLEVVDIYQQPGVAAGHQIIAAPTLVKELPRPVRRMVGDMANRNHVLVVLNIQKTAELNEPARAR